MDGLLLLQFALVPPQFQHQIAHLAVQLIYLTIFVQDQALQLTDSRCQPALAHGRRRHCIFLLSPFFLFEGRGRRGTFFELLPEVVGQMCGPQFIVLLLEPVVLLDDAVEILGLVLESVLVVLHHFRHLLSDPGRESERHLEGQAVLAIFGRSRQRVQRELLVVLLVALLLQGDGAGGESES